MMMWKAVEEFLKAKNQIKSAQPGREITIKETVTIV